MNKLPILFLLLFILSSCDTQPIHFENEDIKFKLPKWWVEKQTDEPVDGNKFYIFQCGRYIAKGLVTVVIRQGEQDLVSLINFYGKSMESLEVGPITVESNFDSPLPSKFGRYKSLTANVEMKILGAKSDGQIHGFHFSNKTFLISIQEVSGNRGVYEDVIKKMEESLVLK